jgi:hypothetical protein
VPRSLGKQASSQHDFSTRFPWAYPVVSRSRRRFEVAAAITVASASPTDPRHRPFERQLLAEIAVFLGREVEDVERKAFERNRPNSANLGLIVPNRPNS